MPVLFSVLRVKTIHYSTSQVFQGLSTHCEDMSEANVAVSGVITERSHPSPQRRGQHKRKAYTAFTDEQRAVVGWYNAEHRNTAAVNRG